ncbi:MAG TPA: beta-propeller fold lactonase family protein [Terriglobales bacterium]|nr:beta-propeller fold lactonase family protein [Terriglobales bacterium]
MPRQFRKIGSLFFLGFWVFGMLSCGSSSRTSGILLATSQGSLDVNSYGINLNTGILTQLNTAARVPANTVPGPIVLDPSRNFAYVGNSTSGGVAGSISAFSVDKNGKLNSVGSNVGTGVNPVALAIDGGNHFLFVANQLSNNVSVFTIGSNAGLTEVPGSPFQTGVLPPPTPTSTATPNSLAIIPSGAFLYVANQGQNTITAFAVSGSGVLSFVGGIDTAAAFAAGSTPAGVTVDPSGKFLYVANSGSNNVSAFVICATPLPGCPSNFTPGSLVPVPGSPFSAGLGPVSLAVDPSDNFLYVADTTSNQLSGYRINASTGALTPLSTPTFSTGTTPMSVAIHPAGNYLYVSNNGADTISGFHLVTQSGLLESLTAVPAASRPAGIALK